MSNDAPILLAKHHDDASVSLAETCSAASRPRKRSPSHPVPEICVLDPDGR